MKGLVEYCRKENEINENRITTKQFQKAKRLTNLRTTDVLTQAEKNR